MITADQMVQREVLCCMSSLVSTLAQGGDTGRARNKLESLCDQACELAAPVLDYEEAARQAGWKTDTDGKIYFDDRGEIVFAKTWEATYHNGEDVLPYEREVFEFWAVSQWLAEKLQAQGERVDTDFAGLSIWARTTTGQSIGMDGCIQRIYADMMAPHTLDSVAPGA